MNTKTDIKDRVLKFLQSPRPIERVFPFGAPAAILAAAVLLLSSAAWAGGVVTNCTEAALRAAMAGGGIVTFACDGTLLLADTITNLSDTKLDGSGRQVTISGNKTVRVFYINTNVSFTLVNLTIADGTSLGGSAILNLGGTVNLTGVTLRSNTATINAPNDTITPQASGGAIFNRGGTVNGSNCSFTTNNVQTPAFHSGSQAPVCGGAIRNEAGKVHLQSCVFVGNGASGGTSILGPEGDPGLGGAIHNSGALTLDLCTLEGNFATGGAADLSEGLSAPGGEGSGGGIFNQGVLTAHQTTLSRNTAAGGRGAGAAGSAGTVPGRSGGAGGAANGAAICNLGWLSVSSSTLASNVVTGGVGGTGQLGGTDPDGNYGMSGGAGGNGGSGLGGALFNTNVASLVNCTIAFNPGSGGDGGTGGQGMMGWDVGGDGGAGGKGGAGCGGVDGTCNLTNCTLAWNLGNGGRGGHGGSGGYSIKRPGAYGPPGTNVTAYSGAVFGTLVNTLIVSCFPTTNDSFPDPKLGPLADNGGPTLTMALLPGSPAIDAGNTSLAPATDQRGVPRPFSLAADIGALEFWPTLRASPTGSSGINLLASGISGQTCRLLASSNLLNWMPLATNQIGSQGTALFYDTCAPNGTCRYYRLVMP